MESHLVSNHSGDGQLSSGPLLSYRLDLAYIGSDFLGWQSQPQGRTVQDLIEQALTTILREKIRIVGASRTDTGVHAEHQVACFRTLQAIDCSKVRRSLAGLLPASIGVYQIAPVTSNFHPIAQAVAKVYRYRIWQGSGLSPFLKSFVWAHPSQLDPKLMMAASRDLLGRHNFRSFCASDASVQTYDRTILDIKWAVQDSLIEFYILGDGFLKQMVRSLVGTLVDIGAGKRPVNALQAIIESQDRCQAGQTAPAQGLSLLRIFYEPILTIPANLQSAPGQFSFLLNPLAAAAEVKGI